MKNPKFKPKLPTQNDLIDMHFVKFASISHIYSAECPICKNQMKRLDDNRFVCDPNTRKQYAHYKSKQYVHYKRYKPEPIELIEKYQLNFSEGCFVKYMLRCEFKGDKLGDLKKALYYLNRCKQGSFRKSIKPEELISYYISHKFSDTHLDCVLWFIARYNFGDIKRFLEREIHNLEELQNG